MKSITLILLAAVLARAAPLFNPCDTVTTLGTVGSLAICGRQTDLKPYARRSIIARQDDDFDDGSDDDSGSDDGSDDSGDDGLDDGSDDSGDDDLDDSGGDTDVDSSDSDASPDDSGLDDGSLGTSADDGSADAGSADDDGLDPTDGGSGDDSDDDPDTTDGLDGTDADDDGTDTTDGTDDSSDLSGASNSTDTSDTSDDSDSTTTPDDSATNSTSTATPSATDTANSTTTPDDSATNSTSTATPSATDTANSTAATAPASNTTCAASATGPNDATLALIEQFEGFVPSPSPDPIGLPTVGFGHKCQKANCAEVTFPFPLTQDTATQLLENDSQTFVNCLHSLISNSVTLNDNQFGALTSFAFNLGCGTVQTSTLLKRLNNGEDPNTVAAAEIPRFDQAGGKVSSGLSRRRAAEVQLFQTASTVVAHPLC